MIKYYKTEDNMVQETLTVEKGCWISVVNPSESEISHIIEEFRLDAGFVKSSLDEEESSRIEAEDDQTLIIIDYPVSYDDPQNPAKLFSTMPMGIILTKTNVVTISLKDNDIIKEMAGNVFKNVNTSHKTRFVLLMLLRVAYKFLQFLKQIDKLTNFTEKQLRRTMQNKELIQLLDLEKSLVYFSNSLKANEVTLEKILRGRIIKLYEEDQDLLEDVLIEIKQAIDMASIYSSITSSTMEALGSIINNNVNDVMKSLTIITVLMEIPNIVFAYYGMNVEDLPVTSNAWFQIVVSLVLMVVIAVFLNRKN